MSRMIKTSEGWKKTSGNSDQAELDALKSSLAQLEDTETFSSGSPYGAVFRRVGKVVQFQIISSQIASYTANTVLFTVPDSFIPNKVSDTFLCYVFDTTNTYKGIGKINPSGGFSFNNGITNTALRVIGSYIIQ